MPTYHVYVIETSGSVYEVEAADKNEAENIVYNDSSSADVINDFDSADRFEVVEVEEVTD